MTTTINANTKNTSENNYNPHEIFDFENFVSMLEMSEGNLRTGYSAMADLRCFFYYREVLQIKKELDSGYATTGISENFLVDTCEKEEFIKSKIYYHGVKAIKTLLSLNTRASKEGKRFVLIKVNREDGLYDFQDSIKVFDAFEDTFNDYHNPDNLPGYNFNDYNWKVLYSKSVK